MMECAALKNNDKVYEVPPVPTFYWDEDSWNKWWIACGSRTMASSHKEMIKSLSDYWKPILGEGYTLACGCKL